MSPQCTDQRLADIRTRDASWTANYAHMHKSDGYGQAAADRRSLLADVDRLRDKLERVERLAAGNITGCGTCTTILKEFT